MEETEQILGNCRKNLGRGRAIATGIGVFAAVFKEGRVLLRVRREKDSLYGKNLSGKWELAGGGVELNDFTADYQAVIFNVAKRELSEEAGLDLISLALPIVMLPAWLSKNNLIDLAFVVAVPWRLVRETDDFKKKLAENEVRFFDEEELGTIDFISPRMKFLAQKAFDYVAH